MSVAAYYEEMEVNKFAGSRSATSPGRTSVAIDLDSVPDALKRDALCEMFASVTGTNTEIAMPILAVNNWDLDVSKRELDFPIREVKPWPVGLTCRRYRPYPDSPHSRLLVIFSEIYNIAITTPPVVPMKSNVTAFSLTSGGCPFRNLLKFPDGIKRFPLLKSKSCFELYVQLGFGWLIA
jgi:hypothetical protein